MGQTVAVVDYQSILSGACIIPLRFVAAMRRRAAALKVLPMDYPSAKESTAVIVPKLSRSVLYEKAQTPLSTHSL